MAEKPSNLIYGVDDRPPAWMTLFLGFQHICIVAIALVFPVIVVRQMGGSHDEAAFMVSMSMLAGGIGTIAQALPRGPVGSGYLCPQVCGPSFLTASILAAKTGGIPLVLGMTALGGLVEMLFSRVMHKLRVLFPAEVTGLIVALVGLTVIQLAMRNFLGLAADDPVTAPEELTVAGLTLGCMVGLNIWSKGKLRLFCIMIGMAVGYLASWFLGLLGPEEISQVSEASLVYFPFAYHPGWSFDWALVVPVVVATLCSSLKTVGDLTTCQKINDAGWKRPDLHNLKKGLLADGLGAFSAGVLGATGQSTSSSNVGLSIATGATSRYIGMAAGGLLILFAFFPKPAAIFAVMPGPVMGATLLFALSFMVVAGFQIVMSRMLDGRKTFVIGLSLIVGLSVDMLPGAYQGMPPHLQPIFSSSLSAGAVCAVILNLIFRLGIAKKIELSFDPATGSPGELSQALDRQGGAWGARREVIAAAAAALSELLEALAGFGLARGPVRVTASFDELNLDLNIRYEGSAVPLPAQPPACADLAEDRAAQMEMAGFLIRSYVDQASLKSDGGRQSIKLHFQH